MPEFPLPLKQGYCRDTTYVKVLSRESCPASNVTMRGGPGCQQQLSPGMNMQRIPAGFYLTKERANFLLAVTPGISYRSRYIGGYARVHGASRPGRPIRRPGASRSHSHVSTSCGERPLLPDTERARLPRALVILARDDQEIGAALSQWPRPIGGSPPAR